MISFAPMKKRGLKNRNSNAFSGEIIIYGSIYRGKKCTVI